MTDVASMPEVCDAAVVELRDKAGEAWATRYTKGVFQKYWSSKKYRFSL